MSRRRNLIPTYRLHKQSGQAVVTLTDALGGRKDVLLGRHGASESRAEYLRVITEWEACGRQLPAPKSSPTDLTVNELLVRFWQHAERHYRQADGTHTSELNDYRFTLRPMRELYAHLPARDFSPLKLKAVRERMICVGLSRKVINQRIGRICRVFKWGVSEELVPESVYRALTTVRGLQKGRTEARETKPIGPVAEGTVLATVPHLPREVAAMVQLQIATGMRPGEVCAMRSCDLDVSGPIWLYRPAQHKTAWRGKPRVVALGPRAQQIIKPYLILDTQANLFSPAAAVEAMRQERRAKRKTKVQPSQVCRKKRSPKRQPGQRYRPDSYAHAIQRACDSGFPLPEALARRKIEWKKGRLRWETLEEWKIRLRPNGWAELIAWRKAHRWHPNQLRHTHATAVRRRYGLEAAQVVLGHSRADVTQVYAERDFSLAEKVAAEMG
jgi:integrase